MNLLHVDAAVIGGSNAGLSAALTLGRARRSVAVIDNSKPRNAPARYAHNVYTRDGTPPSELRRIGREQLAPYDVRFLNTRVTQASGSKGAFSLTLADKTSLSASRLLLATGVSDDLPDVPGLREAWGTSVFTCPYCHGWEVRDTPLAVLGDGDFGYLYARFIQNWSADLIFVTGDHSSLTAEQADDLVARRIVVIEASVTELEQQEGELIALHLSDGRRVPRNAVFMHPPSSLRGNIHGQLGCTLSQNGANIMVDDMGQTSVPGVYAAGDIVTPAPSIILASASGTKAAAALNHNLVMEAPRPEAREVTTS